MRNDFLVHFSSISANVAFCPKKQVNCSVFPASITENFVDLGEEQSEEKSEFITATSANHIQNSVSSRNHSFLLIVDQQFSTKKSQKNRNNNRTVLVNNLHVSFLVRQFEVRERLTESLLIDQAFQVLTENNYAIGRTQKMSNLTDKWLE